MQSMTVTEIASAVKGVWWNPRRTGPGGERRFHGQPEDHPRQPVPALGGEKFDGHLFIDAALDAGAAGCLCAKLPPEYPPG